MKQDIHKLADWIEKVTREGVAIERKTLARKSAEAEKVDTNKPSQRNAH